MFENANKNGVSFREAHEERSQGFQDKSHLRGTPAPPQISTLRLACVDLMLTRRRSSPYL